MKTMNTEQIAEILKLEAIVQLTKPSGGFWDGGAKDRFVFTPEIERTPGKPAIRWGSYGANCWFVVNAGASPKAHLAALRRKLTGGIPPTILFRKKAE